jgi:hypothetical protein
VYFYRVFFEEEDNTGGFREIDPTRALRQIDGLPNADAPRGRYLVDTASNAVSLTIDHLGREVTGRFANVRRTGLPVVDNRGTTRHLPIGVDEGLYEPSHFVLFRNRILGFERNFYGARAGRLETYVPTVAPAEVDRVRLAIVPRTGAIDRLRRIREVRAFRIRVARDAVEMTANLDRNLHDALEAALQSSGAEDVEITLSTARYSRAFFSLPWLIRNVSGYLRSNAAREGTAELLVRGRDTETGEITELDLLSDVVVTEKFVPLVSERERNVRSETMYEAIREAYQENRQDLERAGRVED